MSYDDINKNKCVDGKKYSEAGQQRVAGGGKAAPESGGKSSPSSLLKGNYLRRQYRRAAVIPSDVY